jgi:hypothetical protein
MSVSDKMLALLNESYTRKPNEARQFRETLKRLATYLDARENYIDEATQGVDALLREVDAFSRKMLTELRKLEEKGYEINDTKSALDSALYNIPSGEDEDNDPAVKIAVMLAERTPSLAVKVPAEIFEQAQESAKAALAPLKTLLAGMKKPLADRRAQLKTDDLMDIHDELEGYVSGY